MTILHSKLLSVQHVVAFVAVIGATLIHEEAAIVGLLLVPLIALKLAGVIAWSWLWVLLPIWGEVAIAALIILGTGTYFAYLRLGHWSERPK